MNLFQIMWFVGAAMRKYYLARWLVLCQGEIIVRHLEEFILYHLEVNQLGTTATTTPSSRGRSSCENLMYSRIETPINTPSNSSESTLLTSSSKILLIQ